MWISMAGRLPSETVPQYVGAYHQFWLESAVKLRGD
jgi:hypothetical protein